MNNSYGTFPSTVQLWKGAILGAVAHSIAIAKNPEFTYELWWEGPNYNRQNGQGTRGTITFMGDRLVGAFCDDNSLCAPWRSGGSYSLEPFFVGMPEGLVKLAHQ